MGWRDHLQAAGGDVSVLPWTGGRRLLSELGYHQIEGRLPQEHGWGRFKITGRTARWVEAADPEQDKLSRVVRGYLVGDRVVPDGAGVDPDPKKILEFSEAVHLLEPGLDRFARVAAGRVREDGPLVYVGQEMPLGPEDEVVRAYQDRAASVHSVQGVTPALDAAFRMETWQRAEAERRRAELERRLAEEEARLAEEEARLAEEERRAALVRQLGDAQGRRAMAAVDFQQAARAALAVGGAEYLDHRPGRVRTEMVVTFRFDGRRFECVCDARTLRIVDAGICLVDHRTNVRGDDRFTLESLPGVIREAQAQRVLHVFRHVDDGDEDPWEDD
jgi:hypothetical protein